MIRERYQTWWRERERSSRSECSENFDTLDYREILGQSRVRSITSDSLFLLPGDCAGGLVGLGGVGVAAGGGAA